MILRVNRVRGKQSCPLCYLLISIFQSQCVRELAREHTSHKRVCALKLGSHSEEYRALIKMENERTAAREHVVSEEGLVNEPQS